MDVAICLQQNDINFNKKKNDKITFENLKWLCGKWKILI
jgi:hypothetical protein